MRTSWIAATALVAIAASGAAAPAWGQVTEKRVTSASHGWGDSQGEACEQARQTYGYRAKRNKQDEGCSCKISSDRQLKARPWLSRYYCTVRYSYFVFDGPGVQR